jgi:hypothetical protein
LTSTTPIREDYSDQWKAKRAWYDKWFAGRLLITEDGPELSHQAKAIIEDLETEKQPPQGEN